MKNLSDLNRYCSPGSLLVIDRKGVLRRIYCPFRVIVIIEIFDLKTGQSIMVESVLFSQDLVLLYRISSHAVPYYNFKIPDQQ